MGGGGADDWTPVSYRRRRRHHSTRFTTNIRVEHTPLSGRAEPGRRPGKLATAAGPGRASAPGDWASAGADNNCVYKATQLAGGRWQRLVGSHKTRWQWQWLPCAKHMASRFYLYYYLPSPLIFPHPLEGVPNIVMSVFVCPVPVCPLVYLKNPVLKSGNFQYVMLSVAVARSSSDDDAIRYVLPVLCKSA